jgi:hypothetical protein
MLWWPAEEGEPFRADHNADQPLPRRLDVGEAS